VLVARCDNVGDVLLSGPAVRAIASRGSAVTYLTSPQGRAAAELLPGVDEVMVFPTPWIDASPVAVERDAVDGLVEQLHGLALSAGALLTSSHQSALPMALLLRLAGVPKLAAVSHDYAGSLLDERIPGDPDVHEVERALMVVRRLGYELPPGDGGALAVCFDVDDAAALELPPSYVVVHPGASVPARTLAPSAWAAACDALASAGRAVVLTGGRGDRSVVAEVLGLAERAPVDLTGCTSLAQLAAVLAGADVAVTGNTGPMHLAAAVGTPVVAAFAPTVPPERWRPWGVPSVLLGDLGIACAGCRARRCPFPGQPCLADVRPTDVVDAVQSLTPAATGALLTEAAR
jgi:ADP-heptose:LPS heptosyltransferase